MFIFSFQSEGKYLIKHIVISGENLTIYFSKENILEIQPTINHLEIKGQIVFAEDPRHHFLHNEFVDFSRAGDSVPHKHLKFHLKNRSQALKEICQHLLERQKNLELRKVEHSAFCAALDKERISHGDKEFPYYIREALDAFDPEAPFFSEDELEHLYAKFENYINSDGLLKMAENLSNYANTLLANNRQRCFVKKEEKENIFHDYDTTVYYDNILNLRYYLLKIHAQDKSKDYNEANTIAKFLLDNTFSINSEIFNLSLERIIAITSLRSRWQKLLDETTLIISSAMFAAVGTVSGILVSKMLPVERSPAAQEKLEEMLSVSNLALTSTVVTVSVFGCTRALLFRQNKKQKQEIKEIMLEELEQEQELQITRFKACK